MTERSKIGSVEGIGGDGVEPEDNLVDLMDYRFSRDRDEVVRRIRLKLFNPGNVPQDPKLWEWWFNYNLR